MSTSEQQVVSQIAEMRESLRAADASRRTGGIVRIASVVVGLVIVISFLLTLKGLVTEFAEGPKREEMQAVLREKVKLLSLDAKARRLMDQAGPIVWEEIQTLTEDIDVQDLIAEHVRPAFEELEPVLRQELDRVRPRLQRILEDQGDRTMAELKGQLQTKLGHRLADIIESEQGRIGGDGALTDEKVAMVIANLRDASLGALEQTVTSRAGNLQDNIGNINEMLFEIPELPEMQEKEILSEVVNVLVALLKDELPPYTFGDEDTSLPRRETTTPAPPAPEGADAPEAPEIPEAARKAREAAKAEAAKAAKEALGDAGADRPAAGMSKEEREEALKKKEEALIKAAKAREAAAKEGGE